ncbi:MAG: hypothetical protein OXD43_09635 [Bacteroidetes bacterium]|nr:hypothetical protein [Bacteroidota bacterium]
MRIVVSIVVLGIVLTNCGNPPKDSVEIRVKAKVAPVWEDAGSTGFFFNSDSLPESFQLFWDRSVPMGGYVHETNPDSQDALLNIHDLLKSAWFGAGYGGTLQCFGITSSVDPIQCNERLLRKFFNGNSSRLDEGIEDLVTGLQNGSMMGAALISDLMATTEHGIGPTGLLPYLAPLNEHFNNGTIHMALLGVRIEYWGVRSGACDAQSGSLGCWFDECQQRYRPLEKFVKSPLYVLVLGRSSERDAGKDNLVSEILGGLLEGLRESGISQERIKYEFMTLVPLTVEGDSDLDWGTEVDFVWHDLEESSPRLAELTPERGYSCRYNSKTPQLTGKFVDRRITISEIPADSRPIDSIGISSTITRLQKSDKSQVNLELNCRSVYRIIHEDEQREEADTTKTCDDDGIIIAEKSKVTAELSYNVSEVVDWSAWSSTRCGIESTFHLGQFTDALRPDKYIATIAPFPPLDCGGR